MRRRPPTDRSPAPVADGPPPEPDLARALSLALPWRPPQRSASWREGHALSRRLSAGGEPHCSRSYVPGDDPRSVDWAATARVGELQVRTGPMPRGATIRVLVDLTASMHLGKVRPKASAAIEAAALVVYSALRAQIPVTVAAFDGAGLTVLGQVARPASAHQVLARLTRWEPALGPLAVPAAIETLAAVVPTAGWTIVVSDLRDGDDSEALARAVRSLGSSGQCAFVVVDDPFDSSPPPGALVLLRDAETGTTVTVDGTDPALAGVFAQADTRWRHLIASAPAASVVVPSSNTLEPLARWLRQGARS